jgi:predicted RNase H-like HicB family nuclease
MNFFDRLSHAWNAFQNKDPTPSYESAGYYNRPDRHKLRMGNDNTIITAIYNRIAIDVSAIDIEHVRVDENENFVEKIKDSSLNYIFSTEANIDQNSRDFIRDVVLSMFDEGYVALVPIDTDVKPNITGAFDIHTLRTGKIITWYGDSVDVEVYNEKKCIKETVRVLKRSTAIIENPLYSVMNEPNSTLRRLVRKLALLDQVDEQSSSGKLDLIIQLPYIIKSEARKKQAEQRRQEIEDQLTGTKYGIAYTDGTEKVVQLGHPIENNLLKQIEYLTTLLYSQLGLTEAVFNGTAKEEEMLNYYNRTIEPIISAITEECQRKFLTKTARAQRQRITFFRDPFKLVPITQLADLSNSLSRNEVITSNELRAVLGFKPSSDPRADQLINSNINTAEGGAPAGQMPMMDDQSFAQQQEMMTNNIDMYLNQMDSMAQSELSHTGENKPAGGYASKYYDPEKAHEYYEKTKRLKGRRSNKGLNEEGIAAAEYMRNQIDTQHQKELDAKTQETQDYLTKQDEDLESTVTNIKAGLEQALEDLRNSTEKNLESSRNKLKTVIDNATQRTMAQAQQLYEKISNTDNEAAKRGFRNQIEQLRDANAKIKDSLTEGFAEDYAKTQTDAASKKESLTKQASKDVSNAKEKTASNKEQAVESYKKTAAELEEKYGKLIEDEMEKIRNNPAFLEPEKTKKSSSSKTGSRKLPHGNYLKNIEAYKKRNKK